MSSPNLAVESHSISHGGQKSNGSSSSGVSQLPTSVIEEIFIKLPINSIIRCKCVCKSWYNLLSDPNFVRSYRINTPFTSTVCSELVTIANPLDRERFYIVEIGRNGDVVRTPFFPVVAGSRSDGSTRIVGSCDGLLCLVTNSSQLEIESDDRYIFRVDRIYNNQTVCVVNPLMGECFPLPNVKRSEAFRSVIYGFGSTASNSHYKVVRLIIRYVFVTSNSHELAKWGEILTLGIDDEWRRFEDHSIPSHTFPSGIALNGFIHWIGGKTSSNGVVYAFDVTEERGHCIPLPPGLGDEPGNLILAVWGDCLCFTDNASDTQVDVWVMKQYGLAESWSRDYILKSWIPADLRSFPLDPITTMRNGDILMSNPSSQSLISFDSKIKRCCKLDVAHVEGAVPFFWGYIPSFTSLRRVYTTNHSCSCSQMN